MQQFRAQRFGVGEDLLDDCTFSAGVALLDADGADFEALVRVADLRMYRAKAAGRARVCSASTPERLSSRARSASRGAA